MLEGFGKPKYGGNSDFVKSIYPNDKAVIEFRILPPMKSLAENGEWGYYYGTHFGYYGVNSKDRSKPKVRPFKCIEEFDFRTKTVTKACPECDLIKEQKAQRDLAIAEAISAIQADLRAKGVLPPDAETIKKDAAYKEHLEEVGAPWKAFFGMGGHSCDRKWHINVMLADGTFAELLISHRSKKLLDERIAKIQAEEGVDPVGIPTEEGCLDGVWFTVKRQGKKNEAQDIFDVVYEFGTDGQGRKARFLKPAPLTVAQLNDALAKCPDLAMRATVISADQIQQLTECSGEDTEVDAIFGVSTREPEKRPTTTALPPAKAPVPVARAAPKPAPAPAPAPAPEQAAEPEQEGEPDYNGETAPAPAVDDEEAAALAALAAVRAKKAAAAPPAPAPAPAPAASAPKPESVPSTPSASTPKTLDAFKAKFARPMANTAAKA